MLANATRSAVLSRVRFAAVINDRAWRHHLEFVASPAPDGARDPLRHAGRKSFASHAPELRPAEKPANGNSLVQQDQETLRF